MNNDHRQYLTDPALKIPESHLKKVCKRSQGSCACRYLSRVEELRDGKLVEIGFVCVKNTPLKVCVDREANSNPKWKAKGDNCDGFINYAQENNKKDAQKARDKNAEAFSQKDNTPKKKN